MTSVDDVGQSLELDPSKVWLRFYGRFLLVRSGTDLIVLAVNACRDATARASNAASKQSPTSDHKVFLTIRQVNAYPTGIDPSTRLVATDVVPFQGALNVWSIDGCSIEVPGQSGVTWPGRELIRLADLNELAPDCDVNSKFLDPGPELSDPNFPFTAIIKIHEGSVTSGHLPTPDFGAMWEFRASDGSVSGTPRPLADMVQIGITPPRTGLDLTFDRLPAGTASANSRKPTINVRPFIDRITVIVSFSNLCSTPTLDIRNDFVDTEFASYYQVFLETPPKLYLPHLRSLALPPTGEPLDRDLAQGFAPFGDCFLGAVVKI
jgi:hypothetical protein